MANAFINCNNLNITATDVPNLAGVTDMSYMFASCTTLNSPSNIGTWNTATITNMASMFSAATAFNQDISAWNIAAVTNMTSMLSGTTAFNQSLAAWGTKFNAAVVLTSCLDNCGMSLANYEATLTGFAATTRTGRTLGAVNMQYCDRTSRTTLINLTTSGGKGWTITGDIICATSTFNTRWDLSKIGASITALSFGVQVASTGPSAYTWTNVSTGATGSGTLAASATTLSISGLPANAIIEVKINPTNFQRININNGADRARLTDVSQWGTTVWTSMATSFYGCNNLANITATDVPTLTGVTDMSFIFASCTTLNSPSNIGTWNTATITNMASMFSAATAFNQDISAWNIAAVTNMTSMLSGTTAFNQSLAAWGTKFNAAVVLTNYLDNCGMSMTTYEATLTGFAATTRTGRTLGAAGLRYCNTSDRIILVTATPTGKGWTITGDVKECTTDPFITRWDLSTRCSSF